MGFGIFLLGAGFIYLWILSYTYQPELSRKTREGTTGVFVYKGTFAMWHNGYSPLLFPEVEWKGDLKLIAKLGVNEGEWFPRVSFLNKLGFYYRDLRYRASGKFDAMADRCWMMPCWFGAGVCWVMPGWLLVRVMRRRRRQRDAGRCAGCGYDLRASPERCPECGLAAGGV